MIVRDEVISNGVIVQAFVYDTVALTTTVEDNGVEVETRPMTDVEKSNLSANQAILNTTSLTQEVEENIDVLLATVDNLNAITNLTNTEINSNPAAVIKDVAREVKTVARQTVRIAKLFVGDLEDTNSGE